MEKVQDWFLRAILTEAERRQLVYTDDPVRYGSLLLALRDIAEQKISGAMAECGVYKGAISKFLHENAPDRTLYLFDTFQGFPNPGDNESKDERFQDTSVEAVRQYLGPSERIVIREGVFPTTAEGLKDESFCLVMIDFDKYQSTLAALEFFYP